MSNNSKEEKNKKLKPIPGYIWAAIISYIIAAILNAIFNKIPEVRVVALIIAVGIIIVLLIWNQMHGHRKNKYIVYYLIIGLFVSSSLYYLISLFASNEDNFNRRVNSVIESYNINKDYSHEFDNIEIHCAHIKSFKNAGIKEFYLKGSTYGEIPQPLYLVNSFEKTRDKNPYYRYYDLKKDTDSIQVDEDVDSFSSNIRICKSSLTADSLNFEIKQVFHSFESLSNNEEGFIIDFRNYVHPPQTVKIYFYSDFPPVNLTFYKIKRNNLFTLDRLVGWFNATPNVYFVEDFLLCNTKIDNKTKKILLDNANMKIKNANMSSKLQYIFLWEIGLSGCCDENLFLIKYKVAGI